MTADLAWITLYGVIDIGFQYDTHSAPFTPYRPAASGNIVRQNDYGRRTAHAQQHGPVAGRPAGNEPLINDLSAVFQVETFFNPQSGNIADSLKSLAMNNGRSLTPKASVSTVAAGQAFQTAYVA